MEWWRPRHPSNHQLATFFALRILSSSSDAWFACRAWRCARQPLVACPTTFTFRRFFFFFNFTFNILIVIEYKQELLFKLRARKCFFLDSPSPLLVIYKEDNFRHFFLFSISSLEHELLYLFHLLLFIKTPSNSRPSSPPPFPHLIVSQRFLPLLIFSDCLFISYIPSRFKKKKLNLHGTVE